MTRTTLSPPLAPGRDVKQARRTLWQALAGAPYRQDFYALLRRIENLWRERPRLGRALRPVDEPVRLAQDPELDFAAAPVSSLELDGRGGNDRRAASDAAAEGSTDADDARGGDTVAPRVGVRIFGLFGPHGALPLHLTELARSRERQHGDATLRAFADLFHHRMLLLFYRAWAQAQPAVDLDRRAEARFDAFVGAFGGLAPAAARARDVVDDDAKRQHSALLGRGVRCAEGLADTLSQLLRVPVRIEMFVGHWLALRPEDRTRLGAGFGNVAARLGVGAVLGERVWDRQSKFRLHIGPLSAADYYRFLPGSPAVRALRDWVRQYVGFDIAWDVRLSLATVEFESCRLSADTPLGYAAWLGGARVSATRADLVFSPEERGRGVQPH